LELFIKGYLTDYHSFLIHKTYEQFIPHYLSNRSERLRNYKTIFPDLSYFEIKLIIVGIERGDLHA
ncbi:MAG UNVERIFIED_CONTAM: hypothetical protein MIJ72_09595, partial [Staphylococcus saprophyticus]